MPALTFYFAPGSSSMAPHIALHETGTPFDSRPLSFARKEQRAPDFLCINPEGRVPTLLVDDRPLTEVAGILFYLARAFPAARLLPNGDIEAEARVIAWMSFIAATVHPARAGGTTHAEQVWKIADRRLSLDRSGWAVDQYSIADIHLFRLFWRFTASLKPAPGKFPSLEEHYRRMMARPAVIRTLEIERTIGYELPG
jgi:glutathione S-transferase